MRIVQVAPLVSPIDETREPIGGAQVLVADLARGLAARGHDVTLAAADGSRLSGVRIAPLGIDSEALRPASLTQTSGDRGDEALQRRAFARVRRWIDAHRGEIDVVHARGRHQGRAVRAGRARIPRRRHTLVAYRRGGLAEILAAPCGDLVTPGDEAGLERAISRAAGCPPQECRRRAERFSLAAMIARYEAIYAAVQGDASQPDRGYA